MREIRIDRIKPNPDQPRKFIDKKSLKELAESISKNGLLEEILVRPKNNDFEIVHGERRWRAYKLLKRKIIKAKVRELSDEETFNLSLIENLQRENLLPIEEARAYKVLANKGLTHEEIAKKVDKTRTYITQKLRLLKLPHCIDWLLKENGLSEGQMRQLLRLDDIIRPHLNKEKANPSLWDRPSEWQGNDWVYHYIDFFACHYNSKSVSVLKEHIDKFYLDICSAMIFRSLRKDFPERIPNDKELTRIVIKQNNKESLTQWERNKFCTWFENALAEKMGLSIDSMREKDWKHFLDYGKKIGLFNGNDEDIEEE